MRNALARLFAGTLATLAAMAPGAQAAYPEKPISIVVPFAPGGATDTTARLLAEQMAKATGHDFIVENKSGAGGSIAAGQVARAEPDGYTLLFGTTNTNGINSNMYPQLSYDAVESFAPVGFVAENVVVLLANDAFPADDLAQAVALLEQKPGQYSYASPGMGTVHHLAMELLKQSRGLDVLHVPYKGAGPAMVDLVAGTVPLMMGGIAPARSYIASGKVKVLGVANDRRFEGLPNGVQYFSDIAPGTAVSSWMGLLAPAGTPPDRIRILSAALEEALGSASLRHALQEQGMQAEFMPPAAFGELIASGMPFWKQAVTAAGLAGR